MKKNQKKQTTKVLGIGKVDLIYTLDLTDQDCDIYSINPESLDTLESLKFMIDKSELYDKISVSSNSQLITSLFYLNKVSKHKMFVEFTSLSPISFSEEEAFLKPILTYVAEHNFLFINENDILPFYKTSITFNIRKGNLVLQTFNLCQNENSNVNRSSAPEDATLFERLMCEYSQFNYLFLDLNEFLDLTHLNLGFGDILNLLSTVDRLHKEISFVLLFPMIISNMNMLNMDSINQISEILSYSDIVLFQRKEAIAYFNLLNQFTSTSSVSTNSPNFRSKSQFRDTEKLFSSIPTRRKVRNALRGQYRIGIFLDDVNSLFISEVHKVLPERNQQCELKFSIIPKQNQANKRLIEEYRKQYELNQTMLNSIFFGAFLSKYLCSQGNEIPFITGCEIMKRCLDLYKLSLEFPTDSEFYYVAANKNLLHEFKEKQMKQEKGFVLDCTNLNTSKLSSYNPLFDNNLSSFFSSQVVRRHLNEQGFINTKGFLLLDPKSKKNVMLIDKSSDKYLKRNKNIMLAIKENSYKMNIENVEKILKYKSKVLNDPSITQLEKLAQTLSLSPKKNKQLPSFNENTYYFKPLGKTRLQPLKMSRTVNNINNNSNILKTSDFKPEAEKKSKLNLSISIIE